MVEMCSYLNVFPHAEGQRSHQYGNRDTSHFHCFFFSLSFLKNLFVLNNCVQHRPSVTSAAAMDTVRSSAPSCVCVLLALSPSGSPMAACDFYVDEAWQNQALFLRVFITALARGAPPVVLGNSDIWRWWTEGAQTALASREVFARVCKKGEFPRN